jgi:hypothetical protein
VLADIGAGLELLLIGNWKSTSYYSGTSETIRNTPANLLNNPSGGYYGFAMDTANTNIVITTVYRWVQASGGSHLIAFYNSSYQPLPYAGNYVCTSLACGSPGQWAWSSLPTNGVNYPYIGWYTLQPNARYYVLSSESAGPNNDPFYDWPAYSLDPANNIVNSSHAYTLAGAEYSASLVQGTLYPTPKATFVPICFDYFMLPHRGDITDVGARVSDINFDITHGTVGTGYAMQVVDLTGLFPNNKQ